MMPQRSFSRFFAGLLLLVSAGQLRAQVKTPEAGSTHTVKAGDTLWGLARQYLGDPFLWSAIYKNNTDIISDPHWIYPNQVLRLNPAAPVSAVPAAKPAAPAAPAAAAPAAPAAEPAPAAPVVVQAAPRPAEAERVERAGRPLYDPSDTTPLFPPPVAAKVNKEELVAFREDSYRALRAHEFYAAGFLTENDELPFGKLLGKVDPKEIAARPDAEVVLFTDNVAAVRPPAGASYRVGDSLLVVSLGRKTEDYGTIVEPSGIARVVRIEPAATIVQVVDLFGVVRAGQLVLPLEPFKSAGRVRAVPVAGGIQGRVVAWPGRQELKTTQAYLFIDKGRKDGVAPGDIFEVRRTAGVRDDGTVLVPEVLATVQVVHARAHTASAIIISVRAPNITTGTAVLQVGKLPT